MNRAANAPQAFWFGPPERRAFGWYHAPAEPSREMGIVLCPPLGHEMLCTHRAYRHLANKLALMGFPSLRFDYHGTGDSAGNDLEGDRVASWVETINDAIGVLRTAGIPRVGLFGMRMGAAFASVVAAARGDVEALALVAPSVSGSSYLHELRAMHKVRHRGESRPAFRDQREGDEEAIGFVFRAQTIDALGKIDLRVLAAKPATRALIVPRDDLPGAEAKIADRMRALGTEVDVVQARGYAATATDDPYVAEVPIEIWDAVAAWMDRVSPTRVGSTSPRLIDGASEMSVTDRVVESALWCGANEHLFGVLSEPANGRATVAVIVANTGANSRVGPNRFNVAMARHLASRGHAVLRVDLGGIGDSPPTNGGGENELFAKHSIDDVRAVIDTLSARGYRRFVAVGLCAGAYVSFHAGLTDPRIAGMVLMNPPAFEWRAGRKVERLTAKRLGTFRSTRYYKHRALHVDTWKRLARGEIHAWGIARTLGERLRDRATTSIKRAALLAGRGEWVMSDLAQKFASLAQRRVRVLMLFNGEEPMLDEIERNLGSMMSWLEDRGLALEIIDDTDHVFAPVWSQERATSLLTAFIDGVASEESVAR